MGYKVVFPFLNKWVLISGVCGDEGTKSYATKESI